MTAPDRAVVTALTNLRDARIITDRDTLNRAWAELTGRTPTAPPANKCAHRSCTAPGHTYTEPAGTWCPQHRPQLWAWSERSPWATPRCERCGQPGAYPRGVLSGARCRAHSPTSIRRYLTGVTP